LYVRFQTFVQVLFFQVVCPAAPDRPVFHSVRFPLFVFDELVKEG